MENRQDIDIKKVSVFCASSSHIDKVYLEEAEELGRLLALEGITVYTGGGSQGLMRSVADGVLSAGGNCVGVIPHFMVEREWLYKELTDVVKTNTMAERKDILRDETDAVVVLAGGIGTLDELFETLALKQLGVYRKPIVILNTSGYFDLLLSQMDLTVSEGFMQAENRDMWHIAQSPSKVLEALKNPTEWDGSKIKFDLGSGK